MRRALILAAPLLLAGCYSGAEVAVRRCSKLYPNPEDPAFTTCLQTIAASEAADRDRYGSPQYIVTPYGY